MIPLVAPLLAACAPVPAVPDRLPPAVGFGSPYDGGNAFARVLRGEIAVAKVYEDDRVLAFMDHAPTSPGHVLVISKTAHARNLLEMTDAELLPLVDVARRIGRAELVGLGADGFSVEQNNGFGQTVPHVHLHVIPRYLGHNRCPAGGVVQPVSALEPIAARLRAALAAQAPAPAPARP